MYTLVSDIDGTIYKNKTIAKKDIRSMKIFSKNNELILATGRNYVTFSKLKNSFDLSYKYCILCNGAIIINSKKNIINKLTFKSSILKLLYTDLIKSNMSVGLSISFLMEGLYYPDIRKINIDTIIKKIPNDISGICIELTNNESNDNDIFLLIKNRIGNLGIEKNGKYIDISPVNVTKATAVKYLVNNKLISGHVVVLGDSNNDISLFEEYDNSFVIKEANMQIKKYANFEVESISECIEILEKKNEE